MRDKLLIRLSDWHVSHPVIMSTVVALLTIILFIFAANLKINMQMRDLLPSGDPKVDQFNEIIDEFATATSIIVVAQGEENKIKAFADELAPRVIELIDTTRNAENHLQIQKIESQINILKEKGDNNGKIEQLRAQVDKLQKQINFKLFQRVDYKAETGFLRDHALMLVKAEDLENTKDIFTNPNLVGLLNNISIALEKEYVGREESISTREKEDGAVAFLDGIESLANQLKKVMRSEKISTEDVHSTADKFLFGEPYFLSYDKSALILNIIPNFTLMDRDYIIIAVEETQALVNKILEKYPDVRAGLSGDVAREHDEQIHAQESLGVTTFIAFIAIFILLIVSFRMWIAPLLAIITLLVGIIWANGLAYLVVGELNLMTAILSIVLLGLGIDFAIHIISGFTEWRAAGDRISEALRKTFLKSGKGIITGALTTACAFLALLISQSRGMKEMGIVTGVGLIAIMLATFLFLPVMLVFRERFVEYKKSRKSEKSGTEKRDVTFRGLGKWANVLGKKYKFTIIISLIVSILMIWSALRIEYERNYMKMEPHGLTSIALTDTINKKFDLSMEYALCLTDGVQESRKLAELFRDLKTVAMTDDISVYLPSPRQQRDRAPHLVEIRAKMDAAVIKSAVHGSDLPPLREAIDRLRMNVMEMQDMAYLGGQDKVDEKCEQLIGDPLSSSSTSLFNDLLALSAADDERISKGLTEFQENFATYFKSSVLQMCSTDPIGLDDLPVSLLDRYSNRARNKFIITAFPAGQLYTDANVLNRFVEDMEYISPNATGTPLVMVAWLNVAARDGKNAILLTLTIVFLVLWIDYRRWHYALIAMIPLALGVFWMVGIMQILGILLSFMTMMGLPLIIGIGIDDGVHIMHRWLNEGNGKIQVVYSSTGRAILLTSLTTMLAFGSMTFSLFPAWAWFGESLFIGVGACFLTTVTILPGILGWLNKNNRR